MKKTLLIIVIMSNTIFACKKDEKGTPQTYWQKRKAEIELQALVDLNKAKSILPQSISSSNDFLFINSNKINTYMGYAKPVGKDIEKVKLIKTFDDKREYDQQQILKEHTLGTLQPPPPPLDPTAPPLEAIGNINIYRGYYYKAAQEYTTLSKFLEELNGLQDEVIANFNIADLDKERYLFETSTIKVYATDLEVNQEFWMKLIDKNSDEPFISPLGDTTRLPLIEGSIKRSEMLAMVPGTKMGPPYRPGFGPRVYTGCKVKMRDVLIGGVVAGFAGGYGGAVGGGTIGSVIPGAGTVVGGVGGAVLGFAGGFLGGIVTTTIASLIATCGR